MSKCNYTYRIDESDCIECEHSVHSNGKCILHCNKDDWNLPESIVNESDVTNYSQFVNTLRQEFKKYQSATYYGIKFPKTNIEFKLLLKDVTADKHSNGFLRVNSLHLKDCKFYSDVVLEEITTIRLSNCTSTGSLIIGNNVQELNIDNKSQINEIVVSGENRNFAAMSKLFFHSCKIGTLRIKSVGFGSIFIDDSKIQNLAFERTGIKSHLKLRDNPVVKSAKLDIMLFDENSYAEIEGCNFDDLTIKDCQSKPEHFSFLNCNITKNLTVSGSELNKYTFDTVDASKAKILMNNTNFMGNTFTKFNNVKWGEFILSKDVKNRDTFRQLKHVNDQQGNYIQANKFYSLEMEKYGEEVSPFKNFQEWLVFIISKNLSNFSQDWIKPIIWFLFMSVFLYNFLIFFTLDLAQVRELFSPSYVLFSNYKLILIPNILLFATCAISSQNQNFKKFRSGVYFINTIAMSYSLLVYEMVRVILPENIVSFHNFLIFINPFQVYIPENNPLYLALMIINRLLAVVIGYHLVTALRFHTRRK